MDWTLEVIAVPVADVDRAKAFYADQLGFRVDHDTDLGPHSRFVQLTPPGSGCSIVIGHTVVDSAPGSLKGLHLVVPDIRAARAVLVGRGVDVGEVQVAGPEGFRLATDADVELDNVGILRFDDPDGNSWAVQQISAPLATRS
jgi:catechol 2,3-dioxygenase-like lactoylglutathione lyase family enzyme